MGYDEPKSSVRKYPQSVSQMLTGDKLDKLILKESLDYLKPKV